MNTRKTHCRRGHLLSPENIYTWRHTRRCRKCHTLRQRRYQLLFLALLLAGTMQTVIAAPFLVCDPYTANTEAGLNVATFIINGITTAAITSPAVINQDGSQVLHYDLGTAPLTNGTKYTITVNAVNGYGGVSDPSTLIFTKGVPAPPSNLRISPI